MFPGWGALGRDFGGAFGHAPDAHDGDVVPGRGVLSVEVDVLEQSSEESLAGLLACALDDAAQALFPVLLVVLAHGLRHAVRVDQEASIGRQGVRHLLGPGVEDGGRGHAQGDSRGLDVDHLAFLGLPHAERVVAGGRKPHESFARIDDCVEERDERAALEVLEEDRVDPREQLLGGQASQRAHPDQRLAQLDIVEWRLCGVQREIP